MSNLQNKTNKTDKTDKTDKTIVDRIDLQLQSIKNNINFKKILLPRYIYEDQDEIIIYDTKAAIYNSKSNAKITYILDCSQGRKEYLYALRGKTLVVPSNIYYLIIKNYEKIDCYLNLSNAIELEYLELNTINANHSNHSNHSNYSNKITKWAPNLKYLILDNYDFPLDNLPMGLKYLHIPDNYKHPLNNLPSSLIGFVFVPWYGTHYDYSLDYLPHGIIYIALGYIIFNEDLANPYDNLPSTLEILNFGDKDVFYPLNNLPDNLKYLKFGKSFKPIMKLPLELKILDITHYYWYPCREINGYLQKNIFPPGFEKIIINFCNYKINKNEIEALKKILKNIKFEIIYKISFNQ